MHALITAPIPSHPQNHGNRARVYAVCKEIQARGYQVHYVYSGLEGLTQEQETAMRDTWEHVYVMPQHLTVKKQSRRRHYLIDDWHSPELTRITQKIIDFWDIKFCLANYVWQCAWLEKAPPSLPKYIDTHDVFGNRHKALKLDGLVPNWFYTTPKEEAKALSRASTVIAIQDKEAELFRRLSKTPVRTLGFFDKPNYINAAKPPEGLKLKVGYIASNNPINVSALEKLQQEIKTRTGMLDLCDFYLAGPICTTETALESPIFKKLGFVPDVADFYADMDVLVNPNIGGTGLKIKSVEALSFGRPLVATHDAMIGITTDHPMHACANIAALCDALTELAQDRASIATLQKSGRRVFDAYRHHQLETLDILFPTLPASTGGKPL